MRVACVHGIGAGADYRRIRSYVLAEGDRTVGTVGTYPAASEEKIREHGSRAALPVDEVVEVADP